jgi:hypothetical protein
MSVENSVALIKRVEKTHRNLGLPTLFAKVIDIANLGCFIVGERGRGKGAILNTIVKIRHRPVVKIARITPAGLARMADQLEGKELTLVNDDFSSLYTDYLKDAAINLIAHLITEKGLAESWTDKYRYSVKNCTISFLSATQPVLLRKINTLPNWESMYRDRFIRFLLLYPLGTPDYRKDYPEPGDFPIPDHKAEDVTIPKEIRQHKTYERLRLLIEKQTSEGRSMQYLDSLLKAHAWFNLRDTVVEKDLEILELMIPYLLLETLLSVRDDPAEPLRFIPSAYVLFFYLLEHGSASKRKIKEDLALSESIRKQKRARNPITVSYLMEPLLAKGLVRGVYGRDEYRVNPEWYEKYIMPIIKFHQEIGVVTI